MSILIFWDRQAPQGLQMPVARIIARVFDMPVDIMDSPILIKGYDRGRNQHNAQQILNDIQDIYTRQHGTAQYLLLVLHNDLFIPGGDFLFGLSRPSVNIAVISTARLINGYYGREERDDDAIDRIVKEGSHEIGHLMGLDHCNDPECIMFLPRTLDDLDRKKKAFCHACHTRLHTLRQEEAPEREYR